MKCDLSSKTLGSRGVPAICHDVWADILGVPNIDLEANLVDTYELTSLDFARAAVALSAALALDVGHTDLFLAPTINSQTKRIGQLMGKQIRSARIVRLLEVSSRKAPFYLIHAADGHAYNYLRLIPHLRKELSLRAIVSPCFEEHFPLLRPSSVLGFYSDAVLSDLEGNEVILGGWSYGGLLAFQIALELEKLGIRVRGLLLFDCSPKADIFSKLRSRYITSLEHYAIDYPNSSKTRTPSLFSSLIQFTRAGGPVERFIIGSRPNCDLFQLQQLAGFVLGDSNSDLTKIKEMSTPDMVLEALVDLIREADETFDQTFLPGQRPWEVYRAALIYKMHILDGPSLAPQGRVACPLISFAQQVNDDVSGWEKHTEARFLDFRYPFEPLNGKSSHASVMDSANIALFMSDLLSQLERL